MHVRSRPSWQWLAVLSALVLLGVLLIAVVALDHVMQIDYVRIESSSTVVVGVTAGPSSWTRISAVTESPKSISIAVRALPRPGPQTALGVPVELRVQLASPVGDREIIDASTGLQITETRCPLPIVFGPRCVVDPQARL